jgi:PAT family beta-lactamase induction signal transducer AmpG
MPHEEITKRKLPVWAMGLANMPTGFVYGFISTTFGILLVSRGVSVGKVGTISAIAFSPTFWAWIFSPVLDVRFTKRAYAYGLAATAAALLALAVLSLGNLRVFTIALTASCAAIVLYSSAVQGWAPDFCKDEEYDTISGWFNIANLGAAGVFSALAVVFVRLLPLPLVAVVLAMLVFAPTSLLRHFPAPPRPAGELGANFRAMGRDLKRVAREGRIWIGLLIFVSPVCFSLTNLFSSLGADFHASENAVTSLNGPGVAVACSLGCLLAIPLCRRFRRRSIYLLSGVGAAMACAGMAWGQKTLVFYAAGLLVYNFFQGFNYTSFTALEMEIIGPKNALSGTMMAVLTASANIPISGMTKVDSWMHDAHGLNAMLLVDGSAAVAAMVLLLLIVLPMLDRYMLRHEKAVVR